MCFPFEFKVLNFITGWRTPEIGRERRWRPRWSLIQFNINLAVSLTLVRRYDADAHSGVVTTMKWSNNLVVKLT